MELTKEQFLNQNKVWNDVFYYYAIHITDGGAMYLYQTNRQQFRKCKKQDKIFLREIRLDGINFNKFVENIKEIKGE